ncbi:hypothetical protein ERX46_10320 [Brumimicrobium glaciale]|uniref:Uncharacterized protein n=1 Tax=Brumimicrobium glaciale TaxID=200475 RepID=A0A4Q4KKD1_9FLAO|nr:hypothetical protein [Brumimicrobium glaciale]RYM33330.1 hypothetical protein ERX46_10320 [Brumimicrobium glaciale]
MKKFRLPRKTKKRLRNGIWLYPSDEKGSSLMAWPTRIEKDYVAFKNGILRNLTDRTKENRRVFREKLDAEIVVTDEELKSYVDDLLRKELRTSSYNLLIKAKNDKNAIKAYYNLVNACQLTASGERSYGNIACMSIDLAKSLLRVKRK